MAMFSTSSRINTTQDDSEKILDLYMSRVRYGGTRKELSLKKLGDAGVVSSSSNASGTGAAGTVQPRMSRPGIRYVSEPLVRTPAINLNDPTIDYDSIKRFDDVFDIDTETEGVSESTGRRSVASSNLSDDEQPLELKSIPKRISSLPTKPETASTLPTQLKVDNDQDEDSYTINSYYGQADDDDDDDDDNGEGYIDGYSDEQPSMIKSPSKNAPKYGNVKISTFGHLKNDSATSFSLSLHSQDSDSENLKTSSSHTAIRTENSEPGKDKEGSVERTEQPRSALWDDFDDFRFRIKQLKLNSDLDNPDDSLRKSISVQTATSIGTSTLKSSSTMGTSLSTGPKASSQKGAASSQEISSSICTDDEPEYYDDRFIDWDSQNPMSSLPSPPRTDEYDFSERDNLDSLKVDRSRSPQVSSSSAASSTANSKHNSKMPEVSSTAILSRQTAAERHLLEVLEQTKRARNYDVMSVLLDRVASDSIALYNQSPQSSVSAIDRLCISLSDFLIQYGETSAASSRVASSISDTVNARRRYMIGNSRHSVGHIYPDGHSSTGWYESPVSMNSTPSRSTSNIRSSMVDQSMNYSSVNSMNSDNRRPRSSYHY